MAKQTIEDDSCIFNSLFCVIGCQIFAAKHEKKITASKECVVITDGNALICSC